MKHPRAHHGYILLLALSMLSLIMVLVTGLFNRATPFVFFDATIIKREKAKQLALSGLQIAMSQLQAAVPDKKDAQNGALPGTNADKGPSKESQQQEALFKALIPTLNNWQKFALTEPLDGIKATIEICVTCEQGKIDINEVFDFKTKKFLNEGKPQGDMRKMMQSLFTKLAPFASDKNLFAVFEKFLKQRHSKLQEVTQLLQIKEFEEVFGSRQFFEPPIKNNEPGAKGKKQAVYLTDLFTIWSQESTASAWVLTDALCAVFGFTRVSANDANIRKQMVTQAVEQKALAATTVDAAWPKGLQTVYGKDLAAIPAEIKPLLNPSFEPDTFGILCRGTTGNISQKIFAIIERREPEGERSAAFIIKRLYVL